MIRQIEQKVKEKFEKEQQFKSMSYFQYTEVIDKSIMSLKQERINGEKLKGRYKLKIRESLPSPVRINQFANEPIVFHLHKRRDFFARLNGKVDKE